MAMRMPVGVRSNSDRPTISSSALSRAVRAAGASPADAAATLFTRFLKFDPSQPHWPDRDRFVLSAGHGSMLIYALTYLAGHAA